MRDRFRNGQDTYPKNIRKVPRSQHVRGRSKSDPGKSHLNPVVSGISPGKNYTGGLAKR